MKPNIEINSHQQQDLLGYEKDMEPYPKHDNFDYKGSNKLKDKVVILTGGDSGIGKAVAIAFAKEGAKLVISYLSEDEDANDTKLQVEKYGGTCILISGDLRYKKHSDLIVSKTIEKFGKLDVLINHAGEQYETNDMNDITEESLNHIFQTNVYSMFYLTQASLKHMKSGASIVNTVSVVAYRGNKKLIDYSATKGANLTFTRTLAELLADRGIRVNGVAPGPIWTPLIPASFSPDHLKEFGKHTPLGRPGQPYELASAYVYLASNIDSSYVTGQVIHVNGGEAVGG